MNLIDAMKQALADMKLIAENMEDWALYAGDYFTEKHDLNGDIIHANEAIQRLSKAIEEAEKNQFNPDWNAINLLSEANFALHRRIAELEAGEVGNLDGYTEGFNAGKLFAELEAENVEPYSSHVKSLESLVQDADAMFNGQSIEWGKRYLAHIVKFAGITKPPQREWVGLTDDEVLEIVSWGDFRFARAIEAKLKEKNT